ncbi:major facilitator superfamily protein [Hyphomonas polymorpha PS728]|uniref:Major facilitator superfamily protein n=1 Tax=Hyphomonas polymorpha PS728 TaxID=1280954 RepID=A0A062VBE6_9PROT|nr:MFS transporter [Hyphomonas polymorpha]KCZ96643.1 major facilitator superfamily protein [Hyphomonas polymorpha PS728]
MTDFNPAQSPADGAKPVVVVSEMEPEAKAGLGAWWMVIVLLVCYIVAILDRLVLVMLVEPMKLDLGLTDFEISLLLGPAFGLFYAIFGFPLAWASDRFSRRKVIAFGLTLWSVATMLCGAAGSFLSIFAARMGVGIGEAALSPAAYSLIGDRFPRQLLTRALAIYALGPRLGVAVAYTAGALVIAYSTSLGPISLPLIGLTKPWQLSFIIVGLPGIFLALALFTFREPGRRVSTASLAERDSTVLGFVSENKKLTTLLLLGFASVSVASGADSWVPSYFARRFDWQPLQFGPAMSVISLVAAGSILIKGSIVDWLYSRGLKDAHMRFYTWLLGPAAVLSAIAFFLPNPFVFLGVLCVIQVITMGYLVYMAAVIQIITPLHLRGRMTALFLFATTMGVAFGPMAVGWITDFVFRDPQLVGGSLGIVLTATPVIALVAFRAALPLLPPHIARRGDASRTGS